MTPEERQQAFTAEYNALVQKYGIVLEAQLQVEQLGTATLTKPVMAISLVNGWQPPTKPDQQVSEGLYKLPMDNDMMQLGEVIQSPNGHKEKA